MPSKTWSIMATGRPLLVCFDDHSELRSLIDEIQTGLCVDPENAEGLARNIKHLAENSVIRDKMGDNGRHYIDNNLTKRICVEKYYNVLLRAVGKS
jgi:glycosyltransferase involved in cell wall biosynthesis